MKSSNIFQIRKDIAKKTVTLLIDINNWYIINKFDKINWSFMSIPLIYQEETDYLPRTEQIWIKTNDLLSNLCHMAKNLYNEANYIVRQEFTKKDKDGNNCGTYLNYNIIDYLIKSKSKNYQSLPAQTAQQILKILDRNWKSFFEVIKDWKINPDKYLGRPKLPIISKSTVTKTDINKLIHYMMRLKDSYKGAI